ncbi:MAG: 4-hydroxy-tetrahydrodipicolinate reductase [Akkermansiaceae bacterium]|nr:4-hydroxy-tetrahydrodipicolinate reductase [Armatimonadota bacterium]
MQDTGSKLFRVAVAGAKGRMGSETVRAVQSAADMILVAEIVRGGDTAASLEETRPDVLVEFSVPEGVMANVRSALAARVIPLIGTTGISSDDRDEIAALSAEYETPALIAPNFALGAVLLMRFASEAARYLPDVEIIEMHHERKLDAPSGTAARTAEMIAEARRESGMTGKKSPEGTFETVPGARGGNVAGIPIHSVRLPGFVASQEVIFGAAGQRLSLRHDSTDRASFMPGVLLAIRKAHTLSGLVIGLENVL